MKKEGKILMKFMKKTSLLLAIVLSVTSVSTFSNGILAKADENVNVINSVVDSDGGLNYTQGTLQNTKYGEVKGHEENEGKTLIWSGIPYAKAPIGELRWKAPVNTEKWTGTFDATKAGNIGIQLSSGKVIGSEDCLNLDIYRPNTNEKNCQLFFMYMEGIIKQVQVEERLTLKN